jgi:hypothetical protein
VAAFLPGQGEITYLILTVTGLLQGVPAGNPKGISQFSGGKFPFPVPEGSPLLQGQGVEGKVGGVEREDRLQIPQEIAGFLIRKPRHKIHRKIAGKEFPGQGQGPANRFRSASPVY